MLVNIDIIMRVFTKKSTYQISIIGGERSQLKVPLKVLWEFSHFFSFSLGEEH